MGDCHVFFFHKVVCGHGQLPNGLVLPVSAVMKRHEARYLQALQSFSRPARALWSANGRKLSNQRQKQLLAKGHPATLLEQAQQAAQAALEQLGAVG